MLVEIKSDIFENSEIQQNLRHLLGLLFYKGRYDLFVELSLLKGTPAYENIAIEDKVIIEGMFNKAINDGLQPQLIISDNQNPNFYTIDEAIRFLNQPVILVLENSLNDSHFVRAIMKCFGGDNLLKHKNNGWIEFRNAGGVGNIRNLFREILKSFRGLPKSNFLYLRAFVIMDSDKIYPLMDLKKDKVNQIAFLNENNIPFHILEKREMENYLPDEVINTLRYYRDFIDAYLRLSPLQKDYFDLEKGFPNSRFEQLDEEIQNLYANLDEKDKAIFKKQNLIDYPNGTKNFKSEFPKLFNNPLVTKETLQKRCAHHTGDKNSPPYNPNELPDLVRAISQLL